MKRAASIAVIGACLALAAAPGRVAAQSDEEKYPSIQEGPQFVVDHWKYDPIVNVGTNPGLGWRGDFGFSRTLRAEMIGNLFKHSIPGASWERTVYLEFAVSLLVTPWGVRRTWAPYFGGGWMQITTGGLEAGGAPFVLAGVRKPGRSWSPYLEAGLTTRGSRLSVTLGILHRKAD